MLHDDTHLLQERFRMIFHGGENNFMKSFHRESNGALYVRNSANAITVQEYNVEKSVGRQKFHF